MIHEDVWTGRKLGDGSILAHRNGWIFKESAVTVLWQSSPYWDGCGQVEGGLVGLAFAMLLVYVCQRRAERQAIRFGWEVLAKLPEGEWALTGDEIARWLNEHPDEYDW